MCVCGVVCVVWCGVCGVCVVCVVWCGVWFGVVCTTFKHHHVCECMYMQTCDV